MKIAVITFSDFNTNYGSMLQAFALKNFLEGQGHNVTFIRYREFNKPEFNGMKDYCVSTAKKIILNIFKYTKRSDIYRSKENFDMFKDHYLNHTDLCVSVDDFSKLPEFDCYICGSDQIWNINCLGGLREPYFLSFAPDRKRKIAYAASMGDYVVTPEYEEKFKVLLDRLNFISVREKESIPQLQPLTSKQVHHVVDPTFLLSKEQWDHISGQRLIDGEYAVCYLVRRSKFCKDLIRKLSEKYDVPIINLSDNQIYIRGTISKYISCGPLDFVSLIKNAKFTVGTSFHLAAFSTIFGVPFLIAGMESNRARLNNLLSIAGLEENFVTNEQDAELQLELFAQRIPDEKSVYQSVENSKRFLAHALED